MENKITLLATMKEKMQPNSAWCLPFSLCFNEFKKNILQNNFEYLGNDEIVNNLIAESEKGIKLNESEYYIKSGKQTLKLKSEIENELKTRFNTKSDILDFVNFDNDENTNKILIYAILMFNLKFTQAFDNLKKQMPFGKNGEHAKYFGITEYSEPNLEKQVNALFYNDDNDFAISINSTDNKKIILYRTDKQDTFENTFNQIKENSNNCKTSIKVNNLALPYLSLNTFANFEEMKNQTFVRKSDNTPFTITEAMQNLKLTLNNEGAKVKSEAIIGLLKMCYKPSVERDFIFNDIFYLFITEKDEPITALRVEDISLFND